MPPIKRWVLEEEWANSDEFICSFMKEDVEGAFVRYDDHLAEIARLKSASPVPDVAEGTSEALQKLISEAHAHYPIEGGETNTVDCIHSAELALDDAGFVAEKKSQVREIAHHLAQQYNSGRKAGIQEVVRVLSAPTLTQEAVTASSGADRMAQAIANLIHQKRIGSRSEAADAMTDYMGERGIPEPTVEAPLAEEISPQVQALVDALTAIRNLITNAGISNLTNGVQLGAISWYVKMSDSITQADAALAAFRKDSNG